MEPRAPPWFSVGRMPAPRGPQRARRRRAADADTAARGPPLFCAGSYLRSGEVYCTVCVENLESSEFRAHISQHLSPHTVHPACARRKWPCLASGLSASMQRKIEPEAADAVRGAWGGWVVVLVCVCRCGGGGRWQEREGGVLSGAAVAAAAAI